MLALGRGLMANPDLMLLDEPTLGLAPLIAKALFENICLLRERGITILIAEQDTRRTLRTADYAYVLENGEVALSGKSADLMEDPKVKQAYLGV
jgi:branched-chain amino acid transport system ATP-binding protein